MSDRSVRLGWVGLGLMGQALVENLLTKGFTNVKVYNRTKEKCIGVVSLGAVEANSPKEVVETSDITFVMLSSPSVAKSVYCASDGIIAGLNSADGECRSKGIIECASLDAGCIRELSELVHGGGGQFCACPVAGHSGMARNATCQLICAGDELLFQQVSGVLDSISKRKVWVGNDPGSAANLKLILNGLLANITCSVAEALAVAHAAELNVDAFANIIEGHAMNSPLIQLCMDHMRRGNYPSLFTVEHMEKDARLSSNLAESLGLSCAISAATSQTYANAVNLGLEKTNWTAVYESLAKGTKTMKVADDWNGDSPDETLGACSDASNLSKSSNKNSVILSSL